MSTPTTSGWPARAERLADELSERGVLHDPRWRAALLAVPRHELVFRYFIQHDADATCARSPVRTRPPADIAFGSPSTKPPTSRWRPSLPHQTAPGAKSTTTPKTTDISSVKPDPPRSGPTSRTPTSSGTTPDAPAGTASASPSPATASTSGSTIPRTASTPGPLRRLHFQDRPPNSSNGRPSTVDLLTQQRPHCHMHQVIRQRWSRGRPAASASLARIKV